MSMRLLIAMLVVAGLDAWAIRKIFSGQGSRQEKWAWTTVIVLLPIIGLIAWSLFGPRINKPDMYKGAPP